MADVEWIFKDIMRSTSSTFYEGTTDLPRSDRNGTKNPPERKPISFPPRDPQTPMNYSAVPRLPIPIPLYPHTYSTLPPHQLKKSLIVLAGVLSQINNTLGSALPSGTTFALARTFDLKGQE